MQGLLPGAAAGLPRRSLAGDGALDGPRLAIGREAGPCPRVRDTLMDSLDALHKLMRIAFEEGETWLVEVLEIERESVVAQAAVALENRLHKRAERRLAHG